MTPSDLMTYTRQRYNSVGDTLFPDELLLNLIYAASMDLAKKAYVIEQTYTTTTVASTQEYAFPTNAFAIKRVEYDGKKLTPITMREYDALRLQNSTALILGVPEYYFTFNRTISLHATPAEALSLKLFTYNFPQTVAVTGTLDIPTEYHTDLSLYLLSEMSAMEKNYQGAAYYMNQWDQFVAKTKTEQRKRARADGFISVQDSDSLPSTVVGLA